MTPGRVRGALLLFGSIPYVAAIGLVSLSAVHMSGIGIDRTGNIVTNAFHGTSRANAKSILSNGFVFHMRRKNLLLGDGIYFYLGTPKEAMNLPEM